MPSPWRTPYQARFAVALAMFLGYVFVGGAGQALAQDQRELSRAQCEGEASVKKGFTAQEDWAWGQICAGEPANMADYSGIGEDDQLNCNPTGEGEQAGRRLDTQILSSTFIEFIATHPRYTAGRRQAPSPR